MTSWTTDRAPVARRLSQAITITKTKTQSLLHKLSRTRSSGAVERSMQNVGHGAACAAIVDGSYCCCDHVHMYTTVALSGQSQFWWTNLHFHATRTLIIRACTNSAASIGFLCASLLRNRNPLRRRSLGCLLACIQPAIGVPLPR